MSYINFYNVFCNFLLSSSALRLKERSLCDLFQCVADATGIMKGKSLFPSREVAQNFGPSPREKPLSFFYFTTRFRNFHFTLSSLDTDDVSMERDASLFIKTKSCWKTPRAILSIDSCLFVGSHPPNCCDSIFDGQVVQQHPKMLFKTWHPHTPYDYYRHSSNATPERLTEVKFIPFFGIADIYFTVSRILYGESPHWVPINLSSSSQEYQTRLSFNFSGARYVN